MTCIDFMLKFQIHILIYYQKKQRSSILFTNALSFFGFGIANKYRHLLLLKLGYYFLENILILKQWSQRGKNKFHFKKQFCITSFLCNCKNLTSHIVQKKWECTIIFFCPNLYFKIEVSAIKNLVKRYHTYYFTISDMWW